MIGPRHDRDAARAEAEKLRGEVAILRSPER